MNRSDERKETSAAMARTPAAAKSETSREMAGGGPRASSVSSSAGMAHASIEAHNTTGGRMSASTVGAEGVTDDASPKANRKEAMEPERERAEKAAISRNEVKHSGPLQSSRGGQEVPHKNTMGHGPCMPVAKNTI